MPSTLQLEAARPGDIVQAAEILRSGGTVAFATETVYGLGANALSPEAVAKIFAAKQRPSWDPLIVHIPSVEAMVTVTTIPEHLQSRVATLAAAFWPGPLTLLLPRNAAVPDAVTAGRPLVGIRIPAHPVALALLRATELPIAAPSANTFGHTSPTTATHVLTDLDGRIDAVLDAGPTAVGVESTVLDPTQTPMVLYRPGAITAQQLEEVTGVAVQIFEQISSNAPAESLPSPGVGLRHYAPHARLILIDTAAFDPTQTLAAQAVIEATNLGVMLPDSWTAPPASHIFHWGPWDDPQILAQRLFAGLRSLDEAGADAILCPLPPPGPGLLDALRDRLVKAARSV